MPLNWFNIGIGAAGAFALSFLLHTVDVAWIEARHRTELVNLETSLKEKCESDKQITKDANDGLQKQIGIIAGKLAASKRLRATCIVPVTGKDNPAAAGGKHAGQNGISSDWLRDYAADCETYRQQRITLESFIDKVWK